MPQKECDIVVESINDYDHNNGVWFASALTSGEIDVTSIQDMVDKIKEKLEAEDCCLKSLVIMGHGSPGQIDVGDDEIDSRFPQDWKPKLDALKECFCDDAEIILTGCNVGADQEGADLLSLIANNLGIITKAPTGTVGPFEFDKASK